MTDLKALLDAATDGPWRIDFSKDPTSLRVDHLEVIGGGGELVCCSTAYYPSKVSVSDGRLIAMAPDLAARVLELEAALRDVVKMAKDPDVSTWVFYEDTVKAARQALKGETT